MKDQMLDSLLCESYKNIGSHSTRQISEEDVADVREEVECIHPLSTNPSRDPVMFETKIIPVWDGLSLEKVNRYVKHKGTLYEEKRLSS